MICFLGIGSKKLSIGVPNVLNGDGANGPPIINIPAIPPIGEPGRTVLSTMLAATAASGGSSAKMSKIFESASSIIFAFSFMVGSFFSPSASLAATSPFSVVPLMESTARCSVLLQQLGAMLHSNRLSRLHEEAHPLEVAVIVQCFQHPRLV